MNEHKWKCIDGDCLYEDEFGNQFITSPPANVMGAITWILMISMSMPFLIGLTLWISFGA